MPTAFGCYKLCATQQFAAFSMETLRPTDLKSYCTIFGIDFFELHLQCIFCNCYLSLVDLADFYTKCLCLVWRIGKAHACCAKCLCLSAKCELERHVQCSAKVVNLHSLTNKPLCELKLRCCQCLALLDLQEKCDLVARGKDAYLVRGNWRAPCRKCIDREI